MTTDVRGIGEASVWQDTLSPVAFIERSASVFAEKTAVVYGDRRYTYAKFGARVRRLAAGLAKLGLRPGERVAFLCPNIPPMLEAHFGVPMAGGVLVAINTRLATDEIVYIVNHSGARFFFVDAELAKLVEPALDRLPGVETYVRIVDAGFETSVPGPEYEEVLASGDGVASVRRGELDLLSINYTSGTTGQPKGVMYSHRGGYLNALSQVVHAGLAADSNYLWTLPMFHCNGWCFTWGVTAVGATNVCLRKFDPELAWRLVQDERVSHFCGAPTVLTMLAHHPAAASLALPRPVRVLTGGAPPSPTIIATMGGLGVDVVHLYGLTETYGPNLLCEWQPTVDAMPAEDAARFNARQGVPMVVTAGARVVDDAMNDVPADGETIGEVIMRGNTVMMGYFDQPEATADAFRGGWFHSGDLAVMHADGYIELRDRKKDVIISGGENISSIEVEQAIVKHPAVLEAAVVAAPDERWGEVPKAFVALKEGHSATEDEIIEFVKGRIARFKAPKAVEFGELPKTSTGKVQKFLLREKEWAGREKRIN